MDAPNKSNEGDSAEVIDVDAEVQELEYIVEQAAQNKEGKLGQGQCRGVLYKKGRAAVYCTLPAHWELQDNFPNLKSMTGRAAEIGWSAPTSWKQSAPTPLVVGFAPPESLNLCIMVRDGKI